MVFDRFYVGLCTTFRYPKKEKVIDTCLKFFPEIPAS